MIYKDDTESIRVTECVTLVVNVELLNDIDSEHIALLSLTNERVLAQLNHVLDEEVGDFEEIFALLVDLAQFLLNRQLHLSLRRLYLRSVHVVPDFVRGPLELV